MSWAIICFFLFAISFHFFQIRLRNLVWRPRPAAADQTKDLLINGFFLQLINLHSQAVVAQSFLDWKLKVRSFREVMIALGLHRVSGVFLPGVFLAAVFSVEVQVVGFIATALLAQRLGKNLVQTILVLLLLALSSFFFNESLSALRSVLLAESPFEFWFWLSDRRVGICFLCLLVGLVGTFFLRYSGFFLFFGALLYVCGAAPVSNALGFFIGEILAWAFLLLNWQKTEVSSQRILKEWLAVHVLALFLSFYLLLFLRGSGLFLVAWAFIEIILTMALMSWGHFRYRPLVADSSQVIPFFFSKTQIQSATVVSQFLQHEINLARVRLSSIQLSLSQMSDREKELLPEPLRTKTQHEVEALKAFIELAPAKI